MNKKMKINKKMKKSIRNKKSGGMANANVHHVFIIRHGNKFDYSCNPKLTTKFGIHFAVLTGKLLHTYMTNLGLEPQNRQMYVSPYLRTQQTAYILNKILNLHTGVEGPTPVLLCDLLNHYYLHYRNKPFLASDDHEQCDGKIRDPQKCMKPPAHAYTSYEEGSQTYLENQLLHLVHNSESHKAIILVGHSETVSDALKIDLNNDKARPQYCEIAHLQIANDVISRVAYFVVKQTNEPFVNRFEIENDVQYIENRSPQEQALIEQNRNNNNIPTELTYTLYQRHFNQLNLDDLSSFSYRTSPPSTTTTRWKTDVDIIEDPTSTPTQTQILDDSATIQYDSEIPPINMEEYEKNNNS